MFISLSKPLPCIIKPNLIFKNLLEWHGLIKFYRFQVYKSNLRLAKAEYFEDKWVFGLISYIEHFYLTNLLWWEGNLKNRRSLLCRMVASSHDLSNLQFTFLQTYLSVLRIHYGFLNKLYNRGYKEFDRCLIFLCFKNNMKGIEKTWKLSFNLLNIRIVFAVGNFCFLLLFSIPIYFLINLQILRLDHCDPNKAF